MATYPSTVATFTTKTNTVDIADAAHMNAVQDEIAAIEQDLYDGNVYVTRITTGINAAALSTGVVPSARMSGTYASLTANNSTYAFGKSENHLNVNSAITATTANNSTYAFGKSENHLNVNSATHATNATNLNSQPGSYYTNASNLTTGTLPLAQLHGNVVLTTSTTGINASALSTGTVPDARLSGSYTNLTAVTIANTTTTGRILEAFQTYNTAISGTPTITFNCTTGNLWHITNTISSNWTANFTNLGLSAGYATAVTLVVNQGATAYLPTAMQVESANVTINWQAGTPPTPNANKKDVFAFSVLQTGVSTYLVTGQLVSFG